MEERFSGGYIQLDPCSTDAGRRVRKPALPPVSDVSPSDVLEFRIISVNGIPDEDPVGNVLQRSWTKCRYHGLNKRFRCGSSLVPMRAV